MAASPQRITLFLGGDVMTGRGIDQVLPHPVAPHLYEAYVDSALSYVELAERVSGPLAKPVDFTYVWGDALQVLSEMTPDARIVNLETAITTSEDAWPNKGIHYRMHPANAQCLRAAAIDCCVLANNHVLDWGYAGLTETLATLRAGDIRSAGAGANTLQAGAPAVLDLAEKGRVLVFADGMASSGVPREWAATSARAGVNFLSDLSVASAQRLLREIEAVRQQSDLALVSIHWDANWGYAVPEQHVRFAHALIDGGVDVVHGHSSHHAKGIEIYRGKPILYGCGDLLNDYEGIGGQEQYRAELVLMYFLTFETANKRLLAFDMTPMRIRGLRLNRATQDEAQWLQRVLDRESTQRGCRVALADTGQLRVSGPR
jgi:poly-gamma-glutamate synthesis protein (capsule biosynthesis protein)